METDQARQGQTMHALSLKQGEQYMIYFFKFLKHLGQSLNTTAVQLFIFVFNFTLENQVG